MARHWGPEAEADVRRPARSAAPSARGAQHENDIDTAGVRPIIPAARQHSGFRRPAADPDTPQAATA